MADQDSGEASRERIQNADEPVGIDRANGQPTFQYSVITDIDGTVITAFPGLPPPGA